jgi:lysozyme
VCEEAVKKRILIISACVAAAALLLCVYLGYLWPNKLFAARYAIKGVDLSHHLGAVDWLKVAEGGAVRFAYIKATEGSDFVDGRFSGNWSGARRAGLARGAYHYFTITSPGAAQAANFISVVPAEAGCLPPAVDIEEDGWTKERFVSELKDFISVVERHYGCKPVLYLNYTLYEEYIKGEFDDYPLWISDVALPPGLCGKQWLFWQYCDRGRADGIGAAVDLDAFCGSESDFEALFTR